MKEATPTSVSKKDTLTLEELGAQLKALRESQSLTLDEIAAATCIRRNFLEDIEKGEFSRFKALIYARGFVRTYTEFLDAPELWSEYSSHLTIDQFDTVRTPHTPAKSTRGRTQTQKVSMQRPGTVHAGAPVAPTHGFRHSSLRKNCVRVLVLLLLVAAAALAFNWDRIHGEISRLQQDQAYNSIKTREAEQALHDEQKKAEEEAVMQEQLAQAQAEAEPETAEPEPLPEPEPEPVPAPAPVLTIRAKGDCWLRVTQGSRRIHETTAHKGWERTFPLDAALTVRFGIGQNVSISTNGEDFMTPASGVCSYEIGTDGTIKKK